MIQRLIIRMEIHEQLKPVRLFTSLFVQSAKAMHTLKLQHKIFKLTNLKLLKHLKSL